MPLPGGPSRGSAAGPLVAGQRVRRDVRPEHIVQVKAGVWIGPGLCAGWAVLFKRLAYHLVGQPSRVSLAGQDADEMAHPGGQRAPPGRPEPLRHQPPRRRELIGVAEGADRRAYLVGGDTPLAELGGERPAGETTAVVPGLDPCLGEGGVVDQPYLGEPAKD